jgi:hypothetical protein
VADYASAASLAAYLQRALTAAETASAAAACAAATDYIDGYTQRSWQSATVSGEIQVARDGLIRLDRRPIASVTSVAKRAAYLGASSTTLTSPSGYEIINAAEGQLLVNAVDGEIVTVTYTVSGGVPDDIALAANIIAASYLISAPASSLQARGIQKLKAGSAEITYDPIDKDRPIPPTAYALLAPYRAATALAFA